MRDHPPVTRLARPRPAEGHATLAFFEAYFSNFIEGTEFEGTLEQGFALHRSLESPFARAVFMMLLVSEVHPFADGNGRIARIMMNAELVAAGEERIVIPTIYRSNRLSALKPLSQTGHPEPIIRTLDFAQRWTSAVDWRELSATRRELETCNAFCDPGEADDEGIRLRLPNRDTHERR